MINHDNYRPSTKEHNLSYPLTAHLVPGCSTDMLYLPSQKVLIVPGLGAKQCPIRGTPQYSSMVCSGAAKILALEEPAQKIGATSKLRPIRLQGPANSRRRKQTLTKESLISLAHFIVISDGIIIPVNIVPEEVLGHVWRYRA